MSYDTQFRNDMEIIRKATRRCTIYSASYNAHYWYPYKLRSVGNGWDSLDQSCMELMIDSDISDDSITNEEIIAEAVESRANKVIPKDYLGEPEETRRSLLEFERVAQEEFDGIKSTVIPVLQDDHASHAEEHEAFYAEYSHIAVGGIRHFDTDEQVRRLKAVRDIVGDSTHIHGFGMGCNLGLIKAIRQNPNLLDSLDMSTAERAVQNGNTIDWSFDQEAQNIPMPYGEDKTTVNAGFSKSILLMLNYMITDLVDEDRLEEMFYEELGLGELESIVSAAQAKPVSEIEWDSLDNNPRDTTATGGQEQQRIGEF